MLIYLISAIGVQAETLVGKVVGITDGDTITVLDHQKNTYKIRLQGIDAPEKKQAFVEKSKQSLHDLVHGKQVRIEYDKEDKYGRIVGKITLDDLDICLQQLVLGMGWHYKKYQNEQSVADRVVYNDAELKSKSLKLGLWADETPMPPWEFRKK